MRRVLLAVAAFAALSLVGMTGAGSLGRPAPAIAGYPAAELSSSLLFHCLPDATVRVDLRWTTNNVGAQWMDLSLFNNDFQAGTFQTQGPLPSTQTGTSWDGLTPNSWYVGRVNTLTPYGWFASQPLAFMTPLDCLSAGAATAYYPPPTPASCLNLPPTGQPNGCVWTARDDYLTYTVGEPVVYCYTVTQPMYVRIVAQRPDGSVTTITDHFDPGTGACIGPYQASFPLGLRTISMYGGPGYQLLSQTHFYVRY